MEKNITNLAPFMNKYVRIPENYNDEVEVEKKLVPLPENSNESPINGNYTDPIRLLDSDKTEDYINKNSSKLVILEVDESTKESKIVKLEIPDNNINSAKLVNLSIPEINLDRSKLIGLNVDEITKEPKLVELYVDKKTSDPKLIKLEVDPKTGESKLVKLDVDPKSSDPKLVRLEVPEINGNIKIVELTVPDITKDPKIVKLEVDKITKEPKLIELSVENKYKDPIIVKLDTESIHKDPVLVKLEVDKITKEPKLIKLDVPKVEGKIKLVELTVDRKEGITKIESIPDNSNPDTSSMDEYDGSSYFPGTDIPDHSSFTGSLVSNSSNNLSVTELTPEARDKYEKIAEWMGIPGISGINAAMDYENLTQIYDRMGLVGERIKSYLTAALSGKGNLIEAPSHSLSGLPSNLVVRSANLGIRTGAGTSLVDSVTDVTSVVGLTKEKLIRKLLIEATNAYNLGLIATNTDPNRLPGVGGVAQTIKDAIDTTTEVLSGGNILQNVKGFVNRTLSKDPLNVPVWEGGITDKLSTEGYSKHVKDPKEYTNGVKKVDFGNDYMIPLEGEVFEELMSCDANSVGSLTDLRNHLNTSNSSVITNYKNHLLGGKSLKGIGDVGLDSNHVWEMILEPLIDDDLNGGFTYLPSMTDINEYNKGNFLIPTGYGRWLPFTSFELQDKKTTNKSLNLFDGDISYPVSMEFTNELRVTIADDQLKSFRTYFDYASKASIFKSHEYTSVNESNPNYPNVDESSMEVAVYKNITFLCNIYVMAPGYRLIKKYPLLVVLRDYQIEYTGDTEAGPTELALHFSIVGDLKNVVPKSYTENTEAYKGQSNDVSYKVDPSSTPSPSKVIDLILN